MNPCANHNARARQTDINESIAGFNDSDFVTCLDDSPRSFHALVLPMYR